MNNLETEMDEYEKYTLKLLDLINDLESTEFKYNVENDDYGINEREEEEEEDIEEIYGDIAKNEEDLEYEEIVDYYVDLVIRELYELKENVNCGYYSKIFQNLQDIENALTDENIVTFLGDNRLYPDDIMKDLKSIHYLIDKENSFESVEDLPLNVIKDLNDELIQKLIKYPELMYRFDSRLFEELVAEVFKKFGMKVNLTKATRDNGYDIVAFEDTKYSYNKYLIECKRYKPENKVGIQVVDRLIGAHMRESATKSILVTSSSYTKEAKKASLQHKWILELKDYNDIINWLKLHWSKK